MKIIIVVLSILLSVLLTNPYILGPQVYAGVTAPNASQPGVGTIPEDSGVYEGTSLIYTVSFIIRWALGFIGIIVFLIFLFAGFEYATAGGDEAKTKSAQSRMVNAVIGLIIIFFAFVVSNAVLSFVFGTGNAG